MPKIEKKNEGRNTEMFRVSTKYEKVERRYVSLILNNRKKCFSKTQNQRMGTLGAF